jgi:hypothetical protein
MMNTYTESKDAPLFVFEGPSDPNPGPPTVAPIQTWEEFWRLVYERAKSELNREVNPEDRTETN